MTRRRGAWTHTLDTIVDSQCWSGPSGCCCCCPLGLPLLLLLLLPQLLLLLLLLLPLPLLLLLPPSLLLLPGALVLLLLSFPELLQQTGREGLLRWSSRRPGKASALPLLLQQLGSGPATESLHPEPERVAVLAQWGPALISLTGGAQGPAGCPVPVAVPV